MLAHATSSVPEYETTEASVKGGSEYVSSPVLSSASTTPAKGEYTLTSSSTQGTVPTAFPSSSSASPHPVAPAATRPSRKKDEEYEYTVPSVKGSEYQSTPVSK